MNKRINIGEEVLEVPELLDTQLLKEGKVAEGNQMAKNWRAQGSFNCKFCGMPVILLNSALRNRARHIVLDTGDTYMKCLGTFNREVSPGIGGGWKAEVDYLGKIQDAMGVHTFMSGLFVGCQACGEKEILHRRRTIQFELVVTLIKKLIENARPPYVGDKEELANRSIRYYKDNLYDALENRIAWTLEDSDFAISNPNKLYNRKYKK